METIRTRFAPSPTGFLHVGGVRTALFSWAFARKHNGKFILRIEDTDKKRETVGSIEHIMASLRWLGLEWDEGPDKPTNYGPYTQSERLDIYRKYAQELIDRKLAYADPYTQNEVEQFRQQAVENKLPFLYRNFRPSQLKTSPQWYGSVPLRFKVENIKRYYWHDLVRGDLSAGEEALDDFIIIKSDGYPTYNFAHIIDDHLMHISHVIRGEEFLASMPKFLSLYESFGWALPVFVTAPHILGSAGGKKLSKREGAKDVLDYRDLEYLPQAVLNFLASLGWNDGTNQEVYTPDDLVRHFSLERIQKSGARFDETKLNWLNWQHFLLQDPKQRINDLAATHTAVKNSINQKTAEQIKTLVKQADSKSSNIIEWRQQISLLLDINLSTTIQKSAQYDVTTSSDTSLRKAFSIYDDANLLLVDKDLTRYTAKSNLEAAIATLKNCDFSSEETIEKALRTNMQEIGAQPRQYLNLIRWAVTGQKVSPSLFGLLKSRGIDNVIMHLETALKPQTPD